MLSRPRLAPAALAALAAASLGAACSDDSPSGPRPTAPPAANALCGAQGRAPGTTGCPTVPQYVDSALSLMEGNSINQAIAWPSFRSTYRQQAVGATTYRQTYSVLASALEALDPHSSISPPDRLPGGSDAPSDRPELRVQGSAVTPRIGYVWIPGYVGRNQAGRIDSTHAVLRSLERDSTCGWIVDLRANNGGFFFALMASVGPLYASGSGVTVVGGQRYVGDYVINWYYRQAANGSDAFGIRDARDSAEIAIPRPWRPRRPGLPVAVLHSTSSNSIGQRTSITASAGESITLAFRGGPPQRSFGLPTYGVASGRAFFFMADSARIDITDSYMMDRRGFTPGPNPIQPDTTIVSPSPLLRRNSAGDLAFGDSNDPVVAAAVQWLERRPECVDRGPLASRAPARAARVTAPEPTLRPSGRRLPSAESRY